LKNSKTTSDKVIKERAVSAARAAVDKKAKDTILLELSDISAFADYFVICSGENPAQIRAIADSIDELFSKEFNLEPLGVEGLAHGRWVLMDYGDIIVHIFNNETRAFYDLEKLWMDAPKIEI
jgi:ribosome-associated protein